MDKFTVEIRPDKWEENEMCIYRFGKEGSCLCLGMTTEQLRTLRDSIDTYLETDKRCNNSGCKCPDCYRNAGNEVWE